MFSDGGVGVQNFHQCQRCDVVPDESPGQEKGRNIHRHLTLQLPP